MQVHKGKRSMVAKRPRETTRLSIQSKGERRGRLIRSSGDACGSEEENQVNLHPSKSHIKKEEAVPLKYVCSNTRGLSLSSRESASTKKSPEPSLPPEEF